MVVAAVAAVVAVVVPGVTRVVVARVARVAAVVVPAVVVPGGVVGGEVMRVVLGRGGVLVLGHGIHAIPLGGTPQGGHHAVGRDGTVSA
ncbi:hypothetical protein GCM10017602_07410 [Herbiconiux flava]|nr:hypothetical protein GCM10017602_07410 [Herbiconiux flava]